MNRSRPIHTPFLLCAPARILACLCVLLSGWHCRYLSCWAQSRPWCAVGRCCSPRCTGKCGSPGLMLTPPPPPGVLGSGAQRHMCDPLYGQWQVSPLSTLYSVVGAPLSPTCVGMGAHMGSRTADWTGACTRSQGLGPPEHRLMARRLG